MMKDFSKICLQSLRRRLTLEIESWIWKKLHLRQETADQIWSLLSNVKRGCGACPRHLIFCHLNPIVRRRRWSWRKAAAKQSETLIRSTPKTKHEFWASRLRFCKKCFLLLAYYFYKKFSHVLMFQPSIIFSTMKPAESIRHKPKSVSRRVSIFQLMKIEKTACFIFAAVFWRFSNHCCGMKQNSQTAV